MCECVCVCVCVCVSVCVSVSVCVCACVCVFTWQSHDTLSCAELGINFDHITQKVSKPSCCLFGVSSICCCVELELTEMNFN